VVGEGDEAVFARHFQKHINLWRRLEAERQARHREAEQNRSLGGRTEGDR